MFIFYGGIDYGSQDGEVFSSIQYFELSGYFLLDFDIAYSSFRSIVIRRNVWMIEKGEDMAAMSDDTLLKRDHLFVLWVQLLTQETLQFFFQIRSEWIRIVILRRSKLFFKSVRFYEHGPEPDRPIHFVTFFKVFSLAFQMSRAKLMAAYRGLKVGLPAIMNKDSFPGYTAHVFIDRICAPVVRRSNISGPIVLPCPEPMFLPVDFNACFVCANNPAAHYILSYHFIGTGTFGCKTVQQTMKATFTYLNRKDVTKHFLKPFKRKVLSYAKITNERFNTLSIFDRTVNIPRKITLDNLSTSAGAPVHPVLSNNRFYHGYIDNLSLAGIFKMLTAHVFTTCRTKTCTMFNNLIRRICHLQSLAIMPWLSTCFTTSFLPETAGTEWPVLIFRRWQGAVSAVFFGFVPCQFPFKSFYSCNQQWNFSKFLRLHQNDALEIVYYFIRFFHSFHYETNPEIQYIKERNRLFIKH